MLDKPAVNKPSSGNIMKLDDANYYRERAIQEQVAAQDAVCDEARQRHQELAMMYRFRAAMLTTHPSSWAEHLMAEEVSELA